MTGSFSPEAAGLMGGLPPIRRARNWRLYGSDGKRYLDMYADGGRSVLGRRTGASGTVAKASVDMGLCSSLPSFWEKRLEKAIGILWPDFAGMRFFASEAEALFALAGTSDDFPRLFAGNSESMAPVSIAGALSSFERRVRVESPFGEYRTEREKAPERLAFGGRLALGILPLQPAWSFGILLAREAADLGPLAAADPAFSLIPPVKLAVAVRSLSDFFAFSQKFGEAHWSRMDGFTGTLFRRSGPWLYPLYPKADHVRVFGSCLEKGILISPEYECPSLIPGEFDKGEVAPFQSNSG